MKEATLIDCPDCNIVAHAEPVGEYRNTNPYDPTEGNKYSLFKCPQCNSPILVEWRLTYDNAENAFIWVRPKRIFPTDAFHVNPVIPEDIRIALSESIKCYEANLYTPTVIMCRRTLEGFCQTMGVGKPLSLVKAIEKLKQDGKINEQLYQWATLLRDSGNKAAHDIKSNFDREDAKDILDFTIAILDFTYSFKDKFDKFILRKTPAQL